MKKKTHTNVITAGPKVAAAYALKAGGRRPLNFQEGGPVRIAGGVLTGEQGHVQSVGLPGVVVRLTGGGVASVDARVLRPAAGLHRL